MVKEGAYHHPVVLFTKYNMGAYKTVPVVNIPPVRFIGGPTKQVRSGNIQVSYDPEILVAMITTLSVPVEESLSGTGMRSIKVLIYMVCGVKSRHPG